MEIIQNGISTLEHQPGNQVAGCGKFRISRHGCLPFQSFGWQGYAVDGYAPADVTDVKQPGYGGGISLALKQ